jgi:hypothetical protein
MEEKNLGADAAAVVTTEPVAADQLPHAVIDKSEWGDGPWQGEPDRVEWSHAGLKCLLRRHQSSGHWCGYVAVEAEHPLHQVGYSQESPALDALLEQLKQRPMNEIEQTFARMIGVLCGNISATPEMVLEAHGGITFADVWEGEDPHLWWFGFDCAHAGDYTPRYGAKYWGKGYPWPDKAYNHAEAVAANDWQVDCYRDLAFARAQTERLAEQLALIGSGNPAAKEHAPATRRSAAQE